jgi:hypothetical protein
MKHSLKWMTTMIVMSAFISGCSKTDSSSTVNSGSTVTTGFAITGSGQNATVAQSQMQKLFNMFIPSAIALPPPALEDANALTVTLTDAWIVIKELEFKSDEVAGEEEVDGEEIEFEGPYFVDLLTATPESFGDGNLPAGGIKRIKMQLHEAESGTLPAEAPADLDGKSIYLAGTVNGNNFTYAADDSTEFEIAGPTAVTPDASSNMLAVIRIADLFKKIDLSAITGTTNIDSGNRVTAVGACPSIDPEADDLYTCFRKGLETEADFGKDDGGDMDLDEEDETIDD